MNLNIFINLKSGLMIYSVPQDISSSVALKLWKLYIFIYGKSSKN